LKYAVINAFQIDLQTCTAPKSE